MEIKIDGNPGSGNTFQEIHINKVENYNPAATTVTNNYYGNDSSKSKENCHEDASADKEPIRQDILSYVCRLQILLTDDWKSCYRKVWFDILSFDAVASKVYLPGKQKGTLFNRSLVANIIHYLGNRKAFKKYNASCFAELLEGNKDHSVRLALSADPPERIVSRLDRHFS